MRSLFATVVVTALATSSCNNLDSPPPAPFNIYVKVESDPGKPVAGATVTRTFKLLATTGPDGRAMLTLAGTDGEFTDVVIKCPEGLQSPTKPTTIKLTRFADPQKVPEYAVACPPVYRRVVIAIKAEDGANLPVKYLGNTVARTDAAGAAHFLLDAMPGDRIVVALDTSEARRISAPQQNPSTSFSVHSADEILVWEPKFKLEKPKAPPRPTGPKRLP